MADPQDSTDATDVTDEFSNDNTASADSENNEATDIISELRANARRKPQPAPTHNPTPVVRITVTTGGESTDGTEPVTTTVDVNPSSYDE